MPETLTTAEPMTCNITSMCFYKNFYATASVYIYTHVHKIDINVYTLNTKWIINRGDFRKCLHYRF